jgi:hypothetical protein
VASFDATRSFDADLLFVLDPDLLVGSFDADLLGCSLDADAGLLFGFDPGLLFGFDPGLLFDLDPALLDCFLDSALVDAAFDGFLLDLGLGGSDGSAVQISGTKSSNMCAVMLSPVAMVRSRAL